jgi:ABC-type uncharacterized transport system substrate-binding protein
MHTGGASFGRRAFLRTSVGLATSLPGLALLSGGCGLLTRDAPPGLRHIGYISNTAGPTRLTAAFTDGLSELGWIEGRNLTIAWRFGRALDDNPTPERYQGFADELVRLPVEILVAATAEVIPSAMQATREIPIVMVTGQDPVAVGYVANLAHPGGNVTRTIYGVDADGADVLTGKRLELLKAIVPSMVRMVYLESHNVPSTFPSAQSAPTALGIQAVNIDVSTLADIEPAFETASAMSAAASVSQTNNTFNIPQRFSELADRYRVPTMYSDRVFPDAGGMISYGSSVPAAYRRVAIYVDRILKGANPADLPVEQPTTFELVVSRKGLADLGLSLPPEVASQVTEWVD